MFQPNNAGDRTDVDDVSRTLPPHDRQRGLHHMHDAVKVRCELLLYLGGGHLLEITEQTVARIVDQNVNAPETLHCLLDRSFSLCLVGDVQLHKGGVLLWSVRIGFAHLFEISAGRDDAITNAQRRPGNSCSKAAAGARNKPNFAHAISPG